jgi:hypothetical protein
LRSKRRPFCNHITPPAENAITRFFIIPSVDSTPLIAGMSLFRAADFSHIELFRIFHQPQIRLLRWRRCG